MIQMPPVLNLIVFGLLSLPLFLAGTIAFAQTSPNTPKGSDERLCSELPGLKRLQSPGDVPAFEVYFNDGQEQLGAEALALAMKTETELKKFFGIALPPRYQIFLANSNAQFDQLGSTRTDWAKAWWIVGFSNTESSTLIRDPALWDARSRKFAKLSSLLAHELAHSFQMALNGKYAAKKCKLNVKEDLQQNTPNPQYWFNEGLAGFLSGALADGNSVKFDFGKHPHFEQSMSPAGSYAVSSTAVEYLVKTFGRQKILDAIIKMPANPRATPEEANRAIFDTLGLAGEVKAAHEVRWKEAALKKYAPKP